MILTSEELAVIARRAVNDAVMDALTGALEQSEALCEEFGERLLVSEAVLADFEAALDVARRELLDAGAAVQVVREVHRVQGADGNWNTSPYMTGMFNGLELALSLLEGGRQPMYRSFPQKRADEEVTS